VLNDSACGVASSEHPDAGLSRDPRQYVAHPSNYSSHRKGAGRRAAGPLL